MKVLITGCYGFLGYSLAKNMLDEGHSVVGIDRRKGAISSKGERIEELSKYPNFFFSECDISDHMSVLRVFRAHYPTHVVHFAAQYSLPHDTDLLQRYIQSNLAGFINVIENAKLHKVERFVYASSYIAAEEDQAWSMYSVSKAFNENAARIYSEHFGIKTIGLRYGSVFGPFCRKDCAPAMLADKLYNGDPISLSGRQLLLTPFLDVEDAVEITQHLVTHPLPKIHNIATLIADDRRYTLFDLLMFMQDISGIEPVFRGEPPTKQPVVRGSDEALALETLCGRRPKYTVKDSVARFLEWRESC